MIPTNDHPRASDFLDDLLSRCSCRRLRGHGRAASSPRFGFSALRACGLSYGLSTGLGFVDAVDDEGRDLLRRRIWRWGCGAGGWGLCVLRYYGIWDGIL